MIVNLVETGWQIIFQRSHALLAGKIAMQWKNPPLPERWSETLAAIIDHDDGQKDWHKGAHLTEAGAPMDFTLRPIDLSQAKQVIDNARYRSRWIALLTSMHTSALYEQRRGENSDTDQFLDEQKDYQHKLQKSLRVKTKDAEAVYSLMFLCDACSLVLCKNEIPAGGRKTELGCDEQSTPYLISEKSPGIISLSPWPFSSDQFELSIEYFQVNQLAFKSDQELYQSIDQSNIVTRTWQFQKS